MTKKQIFDKLSTATEITQDAPLAPFSTFTIGGPADYFARPKNASELQNLITRIHECGLAFVILGGGSNILISEEGFRGVVIHPEMKDIEYTDTCCAVGAGVGLQKFLHDLRTHGLSGLEHLVGIPGSVGGALAGNAGTSQEWINKAVIQVEAVHTDTGQLKVFSRKECMYAYRNSIFKNSSTWCITKGVFQLTRDTSAEIAARMSAFLKKRNKQPAGDKSAGCIFKNPETIPAGKLIDELGLKGKKIGNIQISKDHGNFMVNLGGGKATDVVKLISYVKQQARDKRGIQLQEEVRYIGF